MKVPGIRLPSWKRPDWKVPEGLSGWQRVTVVVGLAVVLLATMSVAATRPGQRLVRPGHGRHHRRRGRRRRHDPRGGRGRGQGHHRAELTRGVLVVGEGKRWPVTPAGLERRRGRGGGRQGPHRSRAVLVRRLLAPAHQPAGDPLVGRRPGREQPQGGPVRAPSLPSWPWLPPTPPSSWSRARSSAPRPRTAGSSTSRPAPAPWPRRCRATPAGQAGDPLGEPQGDRRQARQDHRGQPVDQPADLLRRPQGAQGLPGGDRPAELPHPAGDLGGRLQADAPDLDQPGPRRLGQGHAQVDPAEAPATRSGPGRCR